MHDFFVIYLLSAIFNITVISLIQVADPDFRMSMSGRTIISFFPVFNLVFSSLVVAIFALGFLEWVISGFNKPR